MRQALGARARSGVWLAAWALAASTSAAAAQLPNQSFEVVPEVRRATVGDAIPLSLRVRLDPSDLLYDTVPQPIASLPDGVRLLSVEKLHRGPDRTMVGRAVVVFFRPGRQTVPVLGLPFMRGVKGLTRGTLPSDSAFVEIVPVAPPGNPALKDIREPLERRGPDWWWVVAGGLAAAGVAAVALLRRRPKREPRLSTAIVTPAVAAPTPDPYERARIRLQEIEQSGRAGEQYAAVADVLRAYLEEAHGIPARRRTTGELVRALPPALALDGVGVRFTTLLSEADLVKFARARPAADEAHRAVQSARLLLDAWRLIPSEARDLLRPSSMPDQ
jgi:hypothetical protein